MAQPPILSYTDYRLYIKDCLESLRESRPWFSLRYLAGQMELDAGNLVKVVQKDRHLPDRCLSALSNELGLNLRETEYLEHLVRFAKARNSRKEQDAYEKLLELKCAKADVLGRDQYAFYKDWRCTAVLALLHLDNFRATEAAIADHLLPKAPVEDVHRILRLLEELGLARRGKAGRWIACKSSLTTGPAWKDLAVRAFQRETLGLALQALDRIPKEDRDISTLTVTLANEDLEKLSALKLNFRKAVLDLAAQASRSDRVWQVNLQVFPLSRSGEERS
ncbi:MAG: TIGR02147 family protein [Fibrobacteres bacterium]|nr:TIGR02147 family protein [Fibrobacterota bacterium]